MFVGDASNDDDAFNAVRQSEDSNLVTEKRVDDV